MARLGDLSQCVCMSMVPDEFATSLAVLWAKPVCQCAKRQPCALIAVVIALLVAQVRSFTLRLFHMETGICVTNMTTDDTELGDTVVSSAMSRT